MSLNDYTKQTSKEVSSLYGIEDSKVSAENFFKASNAVASDYKMTDAEQKVRCMIMRQWAMGDITMQKPRVEFNDLSVQSRMQIDQMSFNAYQPNNGESNEGDVINGWKSNALRPIVRNKCLSIAAHATTRLIFPKVFAWNEQNEAQEDAGKVLELLMEWSGDQSNYSNSALYRVITALTDPASIGYTEYTEVYRTIKDIQEDGTWKEKVILDEQLSGFQDTVVPVDQLYIENFYEPDIQKQGWLIWRRVRSYSLLEMTYRNKYKNFQYINPGVQLVYNDANQSFYQVYDTNMRPDMGEEVIYWNRNLDLKIIMVNGVMLTPCDNPNPRNDKLYPFDKFGYEIINNRCFYYKSLAFKLQPDANIVNTLYPMIIDGTYLNMMPPMINVGSEAITSDVIVPGMVTTLSSPNADLKAINLATNLKAGMDTLFKVDQSISESSQEPIMQGAQLGGNQTAYEISRLEQNANTVLGLFIKMISDHVKQYGKLRLGDIMQYLTVAEVDDIVGDTKLTYKTFFLPNKKVGNKKMNQTIRFNGQMPESQTEEEAIQSSGKLWAEEGGLDPKQKIYEANPIMLRKMKYAVCVSPDVLNPKSEDLERAFKLEIYDRAINNPTADQEQITKDFLFGAYSTLEDPDKYIKDQSQSVPGLPQMNSQPAPMPNQSPLTQMMGKTPLPQSMTIGQV